MKFDTIVAELRPLIQAFADRDARLLQMWAAEDRRREGAGA